MKEVVVKANLSADEQSVLYRVFEGIESFDEHKIQIFIHGSWADNTRTTFSDLDDFVIVDDDYYPRIKGELNKIELNFQRIDPLQHHGHWLVLKSELENYDNSRMPLEIMEESIVLYGNDTIRANIDEVKSLKGTEDRIVGTCRNIEKFYKLFKDDNLNLYDLKRFVGSIVLLPPLILQLKGHKISKREAIKKAKTIFSANAFNAIQWSTELRDNWCRVIETKEYKFLFEKVKEFQDARDWRSYCLLSAPVIDCKNLSTIYLNQKIIDDLIRESLIYIDESNYETKVIQDYDLAYKKVEEYAKLVGAIIVGKFGTIHFPSISDLDMFICFPDNIYKRGCELTNNFISNNRDLNYFFPHSPLYSDKTSLDFIGNIHTLENLVYTYNPYEIKVVNNYNVEYQDFLKLAWSYMFIRNYGNLCPKDLRYLNIRKLMLLIKNIAESVNNLEIYYSLKPSYPLDLNNSLRTKFLKEGVSVRKEMEVNCENLIHQLQKILQSIDLRTRFPKDNFYLGQSNLYKFSSKTYDSLDKGILTHYCNKVYLKLIYQTAKGKSKNGRVFLKSLRCIYNSYKQNGGYINTHVWIIPEHYIKYSKRHRILIKQKANLRRLLKFLLKKVLKNDE